MSRVAVIDCGTNTFNILIVEIENDSWKPVFSNKVSVKLGKGGIGQGVIRADRMARGLDALMVHHHSMMNLGTSKSAVFATSALREASNAIQFINKARSMFGMEVKVIDGEREAELIFEGVKQTMDIGQDYITVMDIGGGSTEFIIANQDGIAWKHSFPLGVSRLFEQIQPNDPFLPDDSKRLEKHLHRVLEPLQAALKQFPSETIVGSSGSFDTLLDMYNSHVGQSSNGLSDVIPINAFRSMHADMLKLDRDQRLKIPGMLPLRVDFMPISTHLINYLVKHLNYKKIHRSAYAMKEGIVKEIIDGKIVLE
ncbi:Ppx/GppA phosphatase family protein [Sanyastnella coralliicola]|uniref:Ppx/GppA phosphatase family protein n=1 Tax=Sanyastnella coralliicola TaxID=3069118 RepID=UPI0027B89009|nr:hypothetical protein [Longitalea sp. SCSIO 12813]